jgi:hypothetical protein
LREDYCVNNRLICLSVLALMIVGTASCEPYEVVKIPASQDVSIDTNKEAVNNTNVLRCEVNVTDTSGTRVSNYSGIPMVRFNISNLEMTDNDIGILVLKAASIEMQGNESAIVAMMPAASDWNENSSYNNLFFNLIPGIETIQRNNIARMAINTDGDRIFAFDVSKKLLDAKDEGNNISFMFMAVSNNSYRVDFNSRESGEGPYLMVMSYPAKPTINRTSVSLQLNESMINETVNESINAIKETISGINQTRNQTLNQTINQTINRTSDLIANKTAVQGPDANASIDAGLQESESLIAPPKELNTSQV